MSQSSQNSPSSSPQISSPQVVVPGTPLTPSSSPQISSPQVVVPGTPQNSSPPPRDPFLSYESSPSQVSSPPGTLATVQRSAPAQQQPAQMPPLFPRQLFRRDGGSRRKTTLLLKRRKSKKSKKLKSKSKRNKMQKKKSNRRRHI